MPAPPTPVLSVVVALISGRQSAVRACLTSLHAQRDPPALEILVPYDEPVSDVALLSTEFPGVRFIPLVGLDTRTARTGAGREHHDALRTLGISQASGRIVALIEDYAVVSKTWAADMMKVLDAHPEVAAVGGAIECGSERLLNRAVYLCDFGRYHNPVPEGPSAFVSDGNVGYRREALEAVRHVWRDAYHETVVNQALLACRQRLWLSPRFVVFQAREPLALGPALKERYVWGRSFAGTRVRQAPTLRRATLAALSFALPFVLTWRSVRLVSARRPASGLAAALPVVFLLQIPWSVGELVGYLTGDPGGR